MNIFKWSLVSIVGVAATAHSPCEYPETMPTPINAQKDLAELISYTTSALGMETPVVIRVAHLTAVCNWNCIAYQDDSALNVLTEERPFLTGVPAANKNSFSRMMCIAQCYNLLREIQELTTPALPTISQILAKWGLPTVPVVSDDILDCNADAACLQALVEEAEFDPLVIGQVVASEIQTFFDQDGWNSQGHMTFDENTQMPKPCTGNCRPFADTTGYHPVNHNGPVDEDRKYIVEGNDTRWRPLEEHDRFGFFSRQEHVTPHIGYTAHKFLNREYKDAADPQYNFTREAELVVERLKVLSGSEFQQASVRFFDNKLAVRGMIQFWIAFRFAQEHSFEDHMLFIYGLSAAEHDAMLQAWREKVKFDYVRPTTVIQRWGDDELETYTGKPGTDGPGIIKARDFQPFIRVMPHAEYPSGSACLCKAYQEFTDKFVQDNYGKDTLGPLLFPCSPALRYQGFPILGCDPDSTFMHQFADMTQVKNICGQSRLWGGMHFTASIAGAEEVCDGLGSLGFDLTVKLKNGSSLGDRFYQGGPRPGCSEPTNTDPTTAEPTTAEPTTAEPTTAGIAEAKGKCKTRAGYRWREAKGKCVRDRRIRSRKDEHGCKTRAGYRWCEAKGKCVRARGIKSRSRTRWDKIC